MNRDATFSYSYSAKANKEIHEIRKKYLPQSESELDELKRLDAQVQSSGVAESLGAGVTGLLVFGLGLCLSMRVIANGVIFVILGILLGIIGTAVMITAYPIYLKVFNRTKAKYTPRILELTEELSGKIN